jgi:dihydroorotate dehydrogenase (fumarate)
MRSRWLKRNFPREHLALNGPPWPNFNQTGAMNLSTTYLGMKLRTPLVPSASPLSEDVDNIKCMEDAGASAIVFHSLFEEQIRADGYEPRRGAPRPANRIPRRSPFFRSGKFPRHARGLRQAHCASKTVNKNPDHRSLNGSTFGGWTTFAREIEQAGADALELNLYSLPTDPGISAEEIETSYLTILTSVIGQVRIPVAVKLSPFFTNLSQFAQRLCKAVRRGLVLFNRFYQPDIELETREVVPRVVLSTPSAMRLPLRWIAILRGRIGASSPRAGASIARPTRSRCSWLVPT